MPAMGALGVFIVTFLFLGESASRDIFDLSDALDGDTTTVSPRKPENQECPNVARDIVLLIDGSSSVRNSEFLSQKLFVALFSKTFPDNTLFSLLQFSNKFQEHFDFRTFQNDRNLNNILHEARQLQGSSYTATAIKKAVEQFTPQKGARSNAQRFLVIVTDGEKTGDPLNYPEVIQEANRAGITRFAVGVGTMVASRVFQRELHTMASQPVTEHTILLRQFSDLMDIQLKQKICASHGTVVPQPTLAPPISCTSCTDPHVLQKLEQLVQGLDQVKSKLDLLAAKVGKCGPGSHG
ncbi:integrin alpha-X-like [Thamnophis elegans]|uniref:integrin alpha-X-like n=1 Tax=Thamnophis elegans TaxID=35005 RepID=UPI00137825E3|nr:integrin alpha-X-like [Thamnophis elegans]